MIVCPALRRYDTNGIFQMQGGKNRILPKQINANRFFWDAHWLEIWKNHLWRERGYGLCFWACCLESLNSISPDLWSRSHPRARTRFWHCSADRKSFVFHSSNMHFHITRSSIAFFEEKSNIFMLGYRDQLKKLEWRHCGGERKFPAKS